MSGRRSPQDRRKNIVQLTPAGRKRLHDAEFARQEMERLCLAPLSSAGATRLIRVLQSPVGNPTSADQAADSASARRR